MKYIIALVILLIALLLFINRDTIASRYKESLALIVIDTQPAYNLIINPIKGKGEVLGAKSGDMFPSGLEVFLTAVPQVGNYILNWSGACKKNTDNPACTLIMNTNKKVGVTFSSCKKLSANMSCTVSLVNGVSTGNGTMTVNGHTYTIISGGFGQGCLPKGDYVMSNCYERSTPGMTVDGFGWSCDLTDKGTFTELRVHPDGGVCGTKGCIGIVGDITVQRAAYEDFKEIIDESGGYCGITVRY